MGEIVWQRAFATDDLAQGMSVYSDGHSSDGDTWHFKLKKCSSRVQSDISFHFPTPLEELKNLWR